MDKEEWDEEVQGMRPTDEWEQVNAGHRAVDPQQEPTSPTSSTQEFYKHDRRTTSRRRWPTRTTAWRAAPVRAAAVRAAACALRPVDDRDAARGVKLYVKRVFIMDDAEQLLPVLPALREAA
jgi:molecular chaperone HtpG